VTDLLNRQREDGGWSQTTAMASDAYATGQALVALRLAGALPTSHPHSARGPIPVGYAGAGRVMARAHTPAFEVADQSAVL
jgi:hypothetical protein